MNIASCPQWLIELASASKTPASKRKASYEPSNTYGLLGSQGSTPGKAVRKVTGRPFDGGELLEYANRLDVGIAVAKRLGLPTKGLETDGRGSGFKCILPGHADSNPSASLWCSPETGAVLYRDWHKQDEAEWYSLAQVYAFLAYGEVKRLNGPELATWQLRLLVEIGILAPFPVPAKALTSEVTESVRQVYDGFQLLLGCKWRYSPYEPTPFSRRFAAAWCGVSEATAGRAIHELQNTYKLIRIVNQHGYLRLWLPSSMRASDIG